ncbi:MAG: sulfatase-like hydrolase/transferase [Cyclobacteriaceae bacterium]|nr:sulfatase-like hydrolase/transferase [Cyclobacteriaceae bacterium]UYN88200.1 MAG: sulfatase-like hydrolase/transferase [Cyclobacteriaceae bacterium]
MRARLKILFLIILYWMAFFSVARLLFLVYNYNYSAQLTVSEIIKALAYGLKMDLSTTGYIAMLCGLLLTTSVFTQKRWIAGAMHSVTFGFLVFSGLIILIDLELYRHWGFRMNITPFFYMGSEAAGMASLWVTIKLLMIFSALVFIFIRLYFKTIALSLADLRPGKPQSALVIFLTTGLLFFPIRGSLSTATMNVGMVYFHKTKMFANHAGINVVWNFLYSLKNDNAIKYPEDFFDKQQTEEYFSRLYPRQDSTYHVLTLAQPNILLIILESFTADVIEPLGGMPGVAPRLNELCREGILFDQLYANGDRTDKGLVSILSAFPAQPKGSIIKYPQKTQRLPYLSVKLEELGYKNSFVYGGDADFANYNSFLTAGRYRHITSVDDFDDDLYTTKWGVHDEYVFKQTLHEIDTTQSTPFFKTVLTLSSHEPFDVPMEPVFEGADDEARFLNSCHYTDKWLGNFIANAKQKPWWKNTLIIITADHGHRFPGNKRYETKEKFRIPMLWIGGVVQKDTVVHTMGNQSDIANTLLAQLGKPSPDFIFSKNLLGSPVKDFAVYIFNDGYGYLDHERYIIFDNPGKQYIRKEGIAQEEELFFAKAYLQKLYSEYNAKK